MSNRKQASYSKPKETQQQPSEVCISFSGCIPRPHVSGYYLAKDMLHKGTIQILRIFFSSFYSFYREERWETNCAIQKLPTADKFCFPSECIAQLDSAPATLVIWKKKKTKFLQFLPFSNYPSSYHDRIRWTPAVVGRAYEHAWQQIDTRR